MVRGRRLAQVYEMTLPLKTTLTAKGKITPEEFETITGEPYAG